MKTNLQNKPDKFCVMCGKPIYYGQNGCMMYDACSTCKPVHYPKPREERLYNSLEAADYWEGQILSRQERYD